MATINASKTGSILMIFTAMVYAVGFTAIWYFVGMTLGILVFLPFALKLKDISHKKFYTLADYFKYNYGEKSGLVAGGMTVFLMFGLVVLNLIAATKIFIFFTNWPFWLCAIIVALIVLGYLLLGGFRAVVKTDIIQYIAMFFILIALTTIIFKGSLISYSDWNLFNTDVATFAGFFLMGILYPFSMPELWQRVYASKDKKTLKKGLLLSATFISIMIKDLVIGAYLFAAATVVLSVITLSTWIKKNIQQRTLLFGFTFGLIGLFSFLINDLMKGELTPTVVLVGLAFSILGLMFGEIVSYFKK